ncbi:hypothetical protein DFJ74DRAFT_664766 [Hyaloraphidium curvatum]|nr:hypothetical protein DFJ74DRAFT_664766 [Hyaloraphidium curvatum]
MGSHVRLQQLQGHLSPSMPEAASVGDTIEDIDTPALVVHEEIMRANIVKMRSMVSDRTSLRPHYKTHKSNDIAAIQLMEGANGLCCAKLFEAEALAYRDVSSRTLEEMQKRGLAKSWRSARLDILVTNEIGIGRKKMDRLGKLASDLLCGSDRHASNRLGVCVDSASQIDAVATAMSQALSGSDRKVDVYVELNHGGNRCGVDTPGQVVALARKIRQIGGSIAFGGMHAYHGTIQHVRKYEERRAKNVESAEVARTTVKLLEAEGFSDVVVTGSGTGTFEFDIVPGSVYTEIQVGSYLFMDKDYSLNGLASGAPSPFSPSLFVLSTIVSSQPPRLVTDAGWKAVDVFVAFPTVYPETAAVDYMPGGDEHGIIIPRGLRRKDGSIDEAKAAAGIQLFAGAEWQVGRKINFFVSHCDPTVNLHDAYVVVSGGKVVDLWRITRGPGL